MTLDYVKYLKGVGVSEELHAEAIACFTEAQAKSKDRWKYSLSAPFVIAWLILTDRLYASDDHLPAGYEMWGNNVSINGDGTGSVDTDGVWYNYQKEGARPVKYSDPEYRGDCYYAPGHHPRSNWARFIWLGLRNRASAWSMHQGRDIDISQPPEFWGIDPERTGPSGYFIARNSGAWQFRQIEELKRWWLPKWFQPRALVRNIGYKINNTYSEKNPRAMVVYIPFSLKRWLG